MRQATVILSLSLTAFWAVGCQISTASPSAAPPPLPPGGGAPLLSDAEATAARKLYINKCTRCHKYYDPAKYSEEEWRVWMTKMSRKAKLKTDQEQLLSRYLDTFRKPASGGSGTPDK